MTMVATRCQALASAASSIRSATGPGLASTPPSYREALPSCADLIGKRMASKAAQKPETGENRVEAVDELKHHRRVYPGHRPLARPSHSVAARGRTSSPLLSRRPSSRRAANRVGGRVTASRCHRPGRVRISTATPVMAWSIPAVSSGAGSAEPTIPSVNPWGPVWAATVRWWVNSSKPALPPCACAGASHSAERGVAEGGVQEAVVAGDTAGGGVLQEAAEVVAVLAVPIRRQSGRTVVDERDRLGQIVVGVDGQHRSEDLLAGDLRVVGDVDQQRRRDQARLAGCVPQTLVRPQ
ncbi:hypothetical protein SMA5143A_0803 [Streptomyces sp. MA5143a]|nr:hypothetical protein SMA5143A_0803 [Streptomyces sp. MA5143a]